jgi:hypothetical protein
MLRRRTAGTVITAALAALIFATPAAAQEAAPCDPASTPTARLKGLPDLLVQGRWHRFTVADEDKDYDGMPDADYTVTMAENGQVFYTATFDQYDKVGPLFVRADAGDGPITVTVAYTEPRSYGDAPDCARTISKTMGNIHRRDIPGAPKASAAGSKAVFRLRNVANCSTRYAPTPVIVSVKPTGGRRWKTVAAVDQCAGWQGDYLGPGQFELWPPTGRTLQFLPRTPARNSVKTFKWKISRANVTESGNAPGGKATAGRTLSKGVITVRTQHTPARRVYAWHGYQVNDEYWNYCVNEAQDVWMDHGNAYCIRPGHTSRKVSLRRT